MAIIRTRILAVINFFLYLIETLHNTLLVDISHPKTLGTHFTKAEDTLYDAQLGGSCVETGNGQPVIDNHPSTHDRAAAVDTARDKGHL